MLRVEHLRAERDDRVLFEDFCFDCEPGTLTQITGMNGSGKTTLLRMLAGLRTPQSGQILWRGVDIRHHQAQYRSNLLYLGHASGVKQNLTGVENLQWMLALGGQHETEQSITSVLFEVSLRGFESSLASSLSAGQRRRIALGLLWLKGATIWILDEPFTALDSSGVNLVKDKIQSHLANQGTVILTTHHGFTLEANQVLAL